MIEVQNVIKSFDGKTILHDVSCKFYTGKTNLIIGQSGSGKTVLMKSIVGLVNPEHGHILFDGRDVMTMDARSRKELRKEIGMLFQGSALFDSETVLGNVMFPLVMFSDMTQAEMRDRALFCLERVNLKGAETVSNKHLRAHETKDKLVCRLLSVKIR
ncbi:MAG: ATP-binding cassette domain-containing protein, partial [Muribaculaceae bacterium]|nr:ATP-binding cassette domain-containing protein [Muribaculaceae bacterium]